MKPRIVLSGVNFVEGGPLSIFQDALGALSKSFLHLYDVTALVHRRELFDVPGIEYREFPQVKGSWARRLRFEYLQCRALSREMKPHLWLAMHDITPDVTAPVRAVYCHNPAPFYRLPLRQASLDSSFTLFRLLYRFLYAYNIQKNNFVVVQQDWMRSEFQQRFAVESVIVAHPSIPQVARAKAASIDAPRDDGYRFVYPALPRVFKNFEVLLEAVRILEKRGVSAFKLRLTIEGTENRYARKLRSDFQDLKSVLWLGQLSRSQVEQMYVQADCLLFPSKLETWGMPISEWKRTAKPMLVADLPYAQETVGEYAAVGFFNPSDAQALATSMQELIRGDGHLAGSHAVAVPPPFAKDWDALFHLLLRSDQAGTEKRSDDGIADDVQPSPQESAPSCFL